MRFVCLGCLDKDAWGRLSPAEQQAMIEACTAFDRELHAQGRFAAGFALQDSASATTIRWNGGRPSQVDGPFAETKELVAGYTIIDVASRAQAVAWASRFPNPHPGKTNEIEVRPFYALEDFEPGEGVDRFRALDAERAR